MSLYVLEHCYLSLRLQCDSMFHLAGKLAISGSVLLVAGYPPVSLAPASFCLPEALLRAQQGDRVSLLCFWTVESYLKTTLDLEHRPALEPLKGQTAVERPLLEAS